MNTTLTIRTNKKVKKNFSLYAKSHGLTLSSMLNNIMVTKPREDNDKHFQVEDMTFEDFMTYQKAMKSINEGNFTKKADYDRKRFAKNSV